MTFKMGKIWTEHYYLESEILLKILNFQYLTNRKRSVTIVNTERMLLFSKYMLHFANRMKPSNIQAGNMYGIYRYVVHSGYH